LARSEADGCNYCLAAHSYIARKLAKVDENESAIDREGRLVGSKRQAAIMFAKPLIETAHKVSDEEFGAALKAGWSDANSIDIIVDDAVAADQLSQQRGADADRLSGRPDHQAEDSLISFLPAASLTVGRPRFRTQSPVLHPPPGFQHEKKRSLAASRTQISTHTANAARIRSLACEKSPAMAIDAVTPTTLASNRKPASPSA